MKLKLFLFIVWSAFFINRMNAQENSSAMIYYNNMKAGLNSLNSAKSYQDFSRAAKQLEEIALHEDIKWIPYYHATYAYIKAAFISTDTEKITEILDKAQELLDRANKLHPHHSEIHILQGFLYQAKIKIDPDKLTNKYLRMAVKEYDHARFLNKENPRPYYLIGQILFHLPKEFGGNKENACKHFQKAAERFKRNKPRSEFFPDWGMQTNQLMLEKCK